MKISIFTSSNLLSIIIFLAGCSDSSVAPNSSQDQISNLVNQSESETYKIMAAINLTQAEIDASNLLLSNDYLVSEVHFDKSESEDIGFRNGNQDFEKICDQSNIATWSFAKCLRGLKIREAQKDSIKSILKTYHANQTAPLKFEFDQLRRMNDSTGYKIQAAIDSIMVHRFTQQEFQEFLDKIRVSFLDTLSKQRLSNKNLIQLSSNYRSALEKIRQVLGEKQFKQFYLCHKK